MSTEKKWTKWTKGPWRVNPYTTSDDLLISGDGCTLARIPDAKHGQHLTVIESEANANLIAAAPEMYEALEWMLPMAEAYLKHAPSHPDNAKLETTRYVLAKARGEK